MSGNLPASVIADVIATSGLPMHEREAIAARFATHLAQSFPQFNRGRIHRFGPPCRH